MEARALGHALSVIAYAGARLNDARAAAESARKKFDEGIGFYWNNIGQTLERDSSLRPYYREFMAALKELDSAIAKARSASDRLMREAGVREDKR
jgi:hypothetical protein